MIPARTLFRTALYLATLGSLAGCIQNPIKPNNSATTTASPSQCQPCSGESAKAAEPSLQTAQWSDLPGWQDDDLRPAFVAFKSSCPGLQKQPLWQATCSSARHVAANDAKAVRNWVETNLRPWQLVNADGSREGTMTGYYEPVLRGSRTQSATYNAAVYGAPDDLITVDLGSLYPELKHMRLRGRLEGKKLVPYYSRAEWAAQENQHKALLWVDDALDLFFMQIQGSGLVEFPGDKKAKRIRLNYADQNGHPYQSIGRWLIDRGELKLEQASMQGIKAWAQANPTRLSELLNANPSLVFFREVSADGIGPPGALGVPLTPERSIAVDPRTTPLGAPVWLASTYPNSDKPLQRLMVAQDTGGAIRGVVRADFYWGSGAAAGAQAGKMKQNGKLWVLLPASHTPPQASAPKQVKNAD